MDLVTWWPVITFSVAAILAAGGAIVSLRRLEHTIDDGLFLREEVFKVFKTDLDRRLDHLDTRLQRIESRLMNGGKP